MLEPLYHGVCLLYHDLDASSSCCALLRLVKMTRPISGKIEATEAVCRVRRNIGGPQRPHLSASEEEESGTRIACLSELVEVFETDSGSAGVRVAKDRRAPMLRRLLTVRSIAN